MTTPGLTRRRLSPGDVAEELGLDIRKVLAWIRSGELRAANVATRLDGRKPRWRIAQADLETFLAARTAGPTPKPAPRRRSDPSIMEYF
jgi:excisionase family DNA binding protein